jgi:hypothetical protein
VPILPWRSESVRVASNIRVLSFATLIGEPIGRTASEESVSSLFDECLPEFCTGKRNRISAGGGVSTARSASHIASRINRL